MLFSLRAFFLSAWLFVLNGCFSSCTDAHRYDKYVKELDSLKIVVEQAVDNFKSVDSMACYQLYLKQSFYSTYINQQLKDTISKSEAENLQAFYATGKAMNTYLMMRPKWLPDAELSIKQLSGLSRDLKNGSIESDEAIAFIHDEKQQAEKIIEELKLNTETIRSYISMYYKSLPVVEELVKQLNNGLLPDVPKDSVIITP